MYVVGKGRLMPALSICWILFDGSLQTYRPIFQYFDAVAWRKETTYVQGAAYRKAYVSRRLWTFADQI